MYSPARRYTAELIGTAFLLATVVGSGIMAEDLAGGLAGVVATHLMFDLDVIQYSENTRTGGAQWFAEAVATFGLVFTILVTLRTRREAVGMAVGLYITAAYWFTASTSFANPAVTIARSFTNTFSGIQPANMPAFVIAQLAGAAAALAVCNFLLKSEQAGQNCHE
jgi:glycerol uptake facilitator-like aquaporin